MIRKRSLVGSIAVQLLFGLEAWAVEITVTADINATPKIQNESADLFYLADLDIENSDPLFELEQVSWFLDKATFDCIFSEFDDLTFCCVLFGNHAMVNSSKRFVSCPIGARSSTFAFSAGAFDDDISACIDPCLEPGPRSPILFSLGDETFQLTNLLNGTRFDLDQDGLSERLSWTAEGSYDGFLALDRDANGMIDHGGELFGDGTPQADVDPPNGFQALAWFDDLLHGGNGDGYISSDDSVFPSLRIWFDLNHDGVSQESELRTLSDLGIAKIDLTYKESARRDRFGNEFRFRGNVILEKGGKNPLWDVFFLRE